MEKKIYERISKIMQDLKPIGRDQKNQQQRFNFRGIDDVYNGLKPLLSKHEVFTTSEILDEHSEERKTKSGGALIYRKIKMRYTFWTVDGSCVQTEVVGEGMDSGDKASNKAMSVAHKYALTQIFSIATQEMDDPDKHSYEIASSEPKKFNKNDDVQRNRIVSWLVGKSVDQKIIDQFINAFHGQTEAETKKTMMELAKKHGQN